MKQIGSQLAMAAVTMVAFVLALAVNEWMLPWLEWAPGIHVVFLPAGVRLLCTLLFAEVGAVGLLLASWLVCFTVFFPDDPLRAAVGGLLSTLAPYLAYRVARRWYGLGVSLQQLTPLRLLVLSGWYALSNALLHHLWFAMQGQSDVLAGFAAMFIGDLTGTLVVLYGCKWLLRRRSRGGHALY